MDKISNKKLNLFWENYTKLEKKEKKEVIKTLKEHEITYSSFLRTKHKKIKNLELETINIISNALGLDTQEVISKALNSESLDTKKIKKKLRLQKA